jgi:glutaryl-CoA dehydrogenase
MIRKTVRDFVEREAIPIMEGCHSREEFPRQLIPRMAELGLFGANLQGYGCAGLNNISYGLICQELERGDSGLRSMVSVQGSLCMHPIHAFGSEQQKKRWLPEIRRWPPGA